MLMAGDMVVVQVQVDVAGEVVEIQVMLFLMENKGIMQVLVLVVLVEDMAAAVLVLEVMVLETQILE